MPLCGFNNQMLDGLKQFHLGLVEHGIIKRSKSNGVSTDQTVRNELRDMQRFLNETKHIGDPAVRELVEALIKYADAFYKLIEKRGMGKYEEVVQAIQHLYFEMDRKYYDELEGKQDDMKILVKHLNSISV